MNEGWESIPIQIIWNWQCQPIQWKLTTIECVECTASSTFTIINTFVWLRSITIAIVGKQPTIIQWRPDRLKFTTWIGWQNNQPPHIVSSLHLCLVSFFNFHSTPWHDNFNFIYLYLSFQFSSCLPCEQIFWHIFPWCYLTSVGWLTQDVCQPNERPQIVTYTNTCATWCFTLFFLLL